MAFLLGLFHGLKNALGFFDFLFRRAVNLVGQGDLTGMDRPLALAAEYRGAVALGGVAVGVGEVAEGPVDWPQARGAGGDDHSRGRVVPHIAPEIGARAALLLGVGEHPVIGVGSADRRRPRLGRSSVVGDAEMQALVALAGAGDGFDIGHA